MSFLFHLFSTCLFIAYIAYPVSSFYPKILHVNDDDTVNKWISASDTFDSIAWSEREIIFNFLNGYLHVEDAKKLSKTCFKSLLHVKNGLKRRELWTYKCKLLEIVYDI